MGKQKKKFNLKRTRSIIATVVFTEGACLFVSKINSFASFNQNNYTSTPTRGDYQTEQWSFSKIGLNDAWDASIGSKDVSVGIVDSGINGLHEDLISNLDTNLSTCFTPYFTTGLEDNILHGTHVSGIIGANGWNNYGVSGVCWDVNMISLRVATLTGYVNYMDIVDAIDYAKENDIPILNVSIGIPSNEIDSSDQLEIISAINDYDGLIVCAAGNSSINLDATSYNIFPASFLGNNILSVGSSDEDDHISSFSNYGRFSVDVFAPGENIYSTYSGNTYNSLDGTSMASPLVAGVACLLKSIDSCLTPLQIRSAILNNVDEIDEMQNKCTSDGRLNAIKAVNSIVQTILTDGTQTSSTIFPEKHRTFKINCQNGRYTITFSGLTNGDVSLYTKASSGPILETEINNANNSISFLCTSPNTLYLKVSNNEATNVSVQISAQNHPHTYDYSHSSYNAFYHRAYCECGDYILEPHLFPTSEPNVFFPCIKCGYSRPSILNDCGDANETLLDEANNDGVYILSGRAII